MQTLMSALLPVGKRGHIPGGPLPPPSTRLCTPRHPIPTGTCSAPRPADEFTVLGAPECWFPRHHDSIFRSSLGYRWAPSCSCAAPASAAPGSGFCSPSCAAPAFALRHLHQSRNLTESRIHVFLQSYLRPLTSLLEVFRNKS